MDQLAIQNGDSFNKALKGLKRAERAVVKDELRQFKRHYLKSGEKEAKAWENAKRDTCWNALDGRPVEEIRHDLWDEMRQVQTWRVKGLPKPRPQTPYLDRLLLCCKKYGVTGQVALYWVRSYYVRNKKCHPGTPCLRQLFIHGKTRPEEAVDWKKLSIAFEDKKKENVAMQKAGQLSQWDLVATNAALDCRKRELVSSNSAPTQVGRNMADFLIKESQTTVSRPPAEYSLHHAHWKQQWADIPSEAEFQSQYADVV
ncbi:hypothetical protein B0I35DRAFT_489216 [Stachybotrys elegans]|uniref:Uncharacterized protein n=1 Tax=Stachybotrys elegans TaxID=80388 RepID=A0A8K0WM59_9HYPO|nr:hypothetical protein B0I35DRAFT_489216 [Stachybotrys elegans]